MARNGEITKKNGSVSDETLRLADKYQRIANRAAHKAQEENRAQNIPNWYSINGVIVSDIELKEKNKK